ncbi:MAG: hypothetical protein AAGF12_01020 [Myxococcota bacterium]
MAHQARAAEADEALVRTWYAIELRRLGEGPPLVEFAAALFGFSAALGFAKLFRTPGAEEVGALVGVGVLVGSIIALRFLARRLARGRTVSERPAGSASCAECGAKSEVFVGNAALCRHCDAPQFGVVHQLEQAMREPHERAKAIERAERGRGEWDAQRRADRTVSWLWVLYVLFATSVLAVWVFG